MDRTTLVRTLPRLMSDCEFFLLFFLPSKDFIWLLITHAFNLNRYVTLIRFDPVYVQHFKCNIRDIRSGYPALHRWMRNLYWNQPAFGETTQFEHIKWHYTRSHTQINPLSITPVGPLPHVLPLDEEVTAVKAARK